MIIPEAGGLAQGGGLPIYESVESDWFRARGQGMRQPEEACTGPAAAGPPAWTSPGDDGWRAAAAIVTPRVGGTTAAGLPKRVPQANLVPGSASDQQTRTATMSEAAQIARSRLANFQRGSRRARAATRQLTPGDWPAGRPPVRSGPVRGRIDRAGRVRPGIGWRVARCLSQAASSRT